MSTQVLVTGATGNVGSAVVRALLAKGMAVRAAGSDPVRLRTLLGPQVAVEQLDFCRPSTFAAAIKGCDRLFLMRPPAISQVRHTLLPFIDTARALGVRQVVFLSVQGADKNPLIPHHAVERHLQAGPPQWTLLRPGFFAQNLGDAYRRDLIERGRLYVPAAAGKVAFIDVRDIAEVAALALQDPTAHDGAAYTLTGPSALGFAEVAQLLSHKLARPIRYQPASLLGYLLHLRRQGAPLGQAIVLTVLHLGLRLGQAATVDNTLQRLLGHPGRTLANYVEDHVSLFDAVATTSSPNHLRELPTQPFT